MSPYAIMLAIRATPATYPHRPAGVALAATADELFGPVAADANREFNPRRRRRLDNAFTALDTAAQTGW